MGKSERAGSAGSTNPATALEWRAEGETWRLEPDGPVGFAMLRRTPTPEPNQSSERTLCPVEYCTRSRDGRYLAWSRSVGEKRDEILVLGPLLAGETADASDSPLKPRVIDTISSEAVWERYADAIAAGISTTIDVSLSWLPGPAQRLGYGYGVAFDAIGEEPQEERRAFDAEAGTRYTLFPEAEVQTARYLESQDLYAAVTETELRLIDAGSGAMRVGIPLDLEVWPGHYYPLHISPDGGRLVTFERSGIVAIRLDDGRATRIALPYTPIGMGHYSVWPDLSWTESGTGLLAFVQHANSPDPLSPTSRISVWDIDLDQGASSLRHHLDGSLLSISTTPSGHFLATWRQVQNKRRLFLADLETGEQFKYSAGYLLGCCEWSPDGAAFLYTKPDDDGRGYLGQRCAPEQLLPTHGRYRDFRWLDDQRFLAVIDSSSILSYQTTVSRKWELRLLSLAGEDELIAEHEQAEMPLVERR